MKALHHLSGALLAVIALAAPATAQLEGPPEFIDYQGRVLDSLGNPVAQGTTENIEMYFRIWNDISANAGPNLLWAEKQIVTVADGNFSVRLGEGDPIQSSAGDNVVVPSVDDPTGPLLDVFDGKDRFLGVSVAPNSVTKPTSEIQPRLAFLTSPFAAVAERALSAETGPSGGIFEADTIGVGTDSPGSLLEVVGLSELSGAVGGGLISAGAIGGNHIALDADDIQSYLDGDTVSTLRLNKYGGDITMGSVGNQTTLEGLFSVFAGGFGGQFKVVDEGPVADAQVIAALDAAFGTAGSQLRFEGDAASISIGQNSAGDFTVENSTGIQRMVVQQTGNVGIGTTAPNERLTVTGGNIRLTSGDLQFRTRSGGSFFIWYDSGMQWTDHTGAIDARMYHRGSFDRTYIVNSDVSSTDGVYLPEGGNAWVSGSDERLKSSIEPITGILDKIEDIRVVGYNMATVETDEATGRTKLAHNRAPRTTKSGKRIKHEIGTIAQDWSEHFPELIQEPVNEDDFYGITYSRIGVVALGAAQELNIKFKEQEARLRDRDQKIADLEARLQRLEALLEARN